MKKRVITGLLVLLSASVALADDKVTFLPYVTANGAQSVKTDYIPSLTDTIEVDFKASENRQFGLFVARQTSATMDLCLFNFWNGGWRLDLQDTGTQADEHVEAGVRLTARYESGVFTLTKNGEERTIIDRSERVAGLTEKSAKAPLAFFASYPNKGDACTGNYMKGDIYGMKIWNKDGKLQRSFRPARDADGVPGFWESVEGRFWTADNTSSPFAEPVNYVCTWTGGAGTGLWSDDANWQDGCPPFSGSSVSFTDYGSTPHVTENDIDNLRLKKLTVIRSDSTSNRESDGGGRVTIAGKKITLTGAGDKSPFQIQSTPVDILAPLEIDAGSTGDAQFYAIYQGVTCRGGLRVVSAKSLGFRTNYEIAFYDQPVDCTGIPVNALTGGGTTRFYSPLTAKSVACIVGAHHTTKLSFHTEGNAWEGITVLDGGIINFAAAGAMPVSTVLTFGTESWPTAAAGCSYRLVGFDQTCDRIESVFPADGSGKVYDTFAVGGDGNPHTLTLRGTDDALCSVKLRDAISLVWDPVGDFTQTFADRVHTTTGSLAVKGGTLRMAGTNTFASVQAVSVRGGVFEMASSVAGCLSGARTLEIGATGRFRIAAGATLQPFTASELSASIDAGGVLEAPEGASLDFKRLIVGGVVLDPTKTYTGIGHGTAGETEVEWIDGGVRVTAANAGMTSWKAAASGRWNDAANWTAGVPTEGVETYVAAVGAPYVVTVDAATAFPKTLRLIGADACVKVASGGSFDYDGADKAADVAIADGAELRVDGGSVSLSRYNGTFELSGTASATGRLTVVSGEFAYTMLEKGDNLVIAKGGAVDLRGGRLYTPHVTGVNESTVRMTGGAFLASDKAVFDTGDSPDAKIDTYHTFGSGETVFSGDAKWIMGRETNAGILRPSAAGDTAVLTFRDHACFTNFPSTLRIGQCADARAIFTIDSDARFGKPIQEGAGMTYALLVGVDGGYGAFNLLRGYAPVWSLGLRIGCAQTSSTEMDREVVGEVRVSGGTLDIWGSENSDWGCSHLNGLVVGDGGFGKTSTCSGRPYSGLFGLSGGEVSNHYSCSAVGVGFAKGRFEQTGGSFVSLSTWPHVVGLAGGEGVHVMSGGSFTLPGNLFIGGAATNDLSKVAYLLVPTGHYPVDRHDAAGTFVFSNGVLQVGGAMVLGADGHGTFERFGADGGITVKSLVLSNTVANAASGATLKFTFDGKNGIKALTVAESAKILPGSKLVIDLGDYDGKGRTLVSASSIEGSFAEKDIVMTGAHAEKFTLRQTGTSVRLSANNGLLITVR